MKTPQVNYILHHKEACKRLTEIKTFHSGHISVYNSLFLLWNETGFKDEFRIIRDDVMTIAKVGSANTYTKILKDLEKMKFIQYKPSYNPLIPSVVKIYNFDKGSDKGIGKGIDNSSDKGDDTINTIKLLNIETIKQLLSDGEVSVLQLKKLVKDIESCLPTDDNDDVSIIVSHFNSTTGSGYKAKTKETRNLISGRLKDYSIEECKLVIEFMNDRWKNDEKMKQYLTPSTLFAEANFEKYLNKANESKFKPKNKSVSVVEIADQIAQQRGW